MNLRTYILKIISTALLCSLLPSFLPDSSASGKIVKLLGSILLTISILSPLMNFTVKDISHYLSQITTDSNAYVTEGNEIANSEIAAIIKAETESYIKDKAADLNCFLDVEITMEEGEVPLPVVATFTGNVSPYTKQILGEILSHEFGISKENQIWN